MNVAQISSKDVIYQVLVAGRVPPNLIMRQSTANDTTFFALFPLFIIGEVTMGKAASFGQTKFLRKTSAPSPQQSKVLEDGLGEHMVLTHHNI